MGCAELGKVSSVTLSLLLAELELVSSPALVAERGNIPPSPTPAAHDDDGVNRS